METVSIVKCEDYIYEDVKYSIKKSLDNIGGIEKYISKGETVFLKVNLLMKKRPEEATTTHPIFVQCLAEILVNYGCKVIIGDSPGGAFNEAILKGIYKVSGMEEAAKKSKAELNFNTKSIEITNHKGLILKKITRTDMLTNVDKVISVSKLKTHGMTRMTGAVKNMFGTIPGVLKAEYHLNMPNIYEFSNALIDICISANPVISIMDSIVAMEGNGPSSGTPRKIGAVLASANPYCLDMAAAYIINVSFESIPTIKNSILRGLCPSNIDEINLVGNNIKDFIIKDFKAPRIVNVNPYKDNMPKFVEKFVNMNFQPRPIFNHNDCVGCGDCMKNCPPKAINMKEKKPYVNLDKCIRCFCCQELCPRKAVTIYRPLFFKLISKV